MLVATWYYIATTYKSTWIWNMQSKILHYMRQMAVITPYAQFVFSFISDMQEWVINLYNELMIYFLERCMVTQCYFLHCSKNVTVQFSRRTDVMPPIPPETKYHPSAVDLLLIKRLIAETTKQNLLQFLQHEFVNIGKSYAQRLIGIFLSSSNFFYLK